MKRSRVHRRRRASRAVIIAALIILIGRIGYQIAQAQTVKTVTLYSPYGYEQWSYTGDFDVTYGENTVIRYTDADGARHTVNALGAVCEISERKV
jgi:hypothetical protein